jgi:hypothetical protein
MRRLEMATVTRASDRIRPGRRDRIEGACRR